MLSKDFKSGEMVSEHTKSLASSLADEGNDVCLLVSESNSDIQLDDVDVHRVSLQIEADNIFNWAMMLNTELQKQRIEAFKQQEFDVIHSQGWLTASAGIKLSQKLETKFYITIHSTENQRGFAEDYSELISSLEWEACYEADRIFATSHEAENSLTEDLEVPHGKLTVMDSASRIAESYGEVA